MSKIYKVTRIENGEIAIVASANELAYAFGITVDYIYRLCSKKDTLWGLYNVDVATESDMVRYKMQEKKTVEKKDKQPIRAKSKNSYIPKKNNHVAVRTSSGVRFQ